MMMLFWKFERRARQHRGLPERRVVRERTLQSSLTQQFRYSAGGTETSYLNCSRVTDKLVNTAAQRSECCASRGKPLNKGTRLP